jgi:hypothetical protein
MMVVFSTATLGIRGDFAILHLRAALRAANNAREVEGTPGDEKYSKWQDDMLLWVPVAVVMSAAALEANANEIIQDIVDDKTSLRLTKPEKEEQSAFLANRHKSLKSRYLRIGTLFNQIPRESDLYFQNALRLLKFRNAFMHFRPVFYPNSTANDLELVEELKDVVPMSSAHHSHQIQFPYSFMSYGCAKWCVQTVLAFSVEFNRLVNLKDKFVTPGVDFNLL